MCCHRNDEHPRIVLYYFAGLLMGLVLLLQCMPLNAEVNEQTLEHAESLEAKARAAVEAKEPQKAAELYEQAAQAFGIQGDAVKQAGALMKASTVYFSINEFKKCEERNKDALNLYQSTPESDFRTKHIARCYLNIGLASKELKQYDEAVVHLEKAIDHFPRGKDEKNFIRCLYTLGDVFFGLGKKEEGNARYQQALELIEVREDEKDDPAQFLERWADALASATYYEDAMKKYAQAETAYENTDTTLRNRIYCSFFQARCLYDLKRYEDAIAAYQRVLNYPGIESNEMAHYRVNTLFQIALSNMSIFHFDEALKYAIETHKLAKDMPGYEELSAAADTMQNLCMASMGETTHDPSQIDELIKTFEGKPEREPFLPDLYRMKGLLYQQNGEYRASLDMFAKALEIAATLPEADLKKAKLMVDKADVLGLSGEYEEAITCYQQARDIFRNHEDKQEDVLLSLLSETEVNITAGQFEDALRLNDEARRMAETFSSPDPFLARCFQSKAQINGDLNKYDEAMSDIKSALNHYRNVSDTQMEKSYCLLFMATLYEMRGQYEKSQECLGEAHTLTQESIDSFPHEKAQQESERLVCLARICAQLGRYTEAYETLQKALSLVDKKPYSEMFTADARMEMANTNIAMGNMNGALEHLEQAEHLYEQSADEKLKHGLCVMVKGQALSGLCRYTESFTVLQRALDLLGRKPGWKTHYADCLMHTGRTLVSLGRFEEAIALQKESADIISGVPNLERYVVMRKLALADIARLQHHYEEALTYLDEADMIIGQLPGTEIQQFAGKMIRAGCFLQLERYQEALTTIEELREYLKAFPEILEAAAETDKIRAISLAALGRYDESLEATKNALLICSEKYSSPRNLADVRFSTAFAEVRLGRTVEAQQELYDAHTALYDLYVPNFPMMTEQQKTEFVLKRFPEPDPVYTLAFSDGNLSVKGLDTALMHKGLIEYALQQEQRILQEKSLDTPGVKSLYETLQELRRRYAALSHAQDPPLSAPVPSGQNVNPTVRKKNLDDLKNQVDATEAQLAAISLPFAEEMRLRRISTNEVHEALNTLAPEGALLEYVKYEPEPFDDIVTFLTPKDERETREAHYGLFILHADSPFPIAIDLGPAAPIDDAVNAFRTTCQNYAEWVEKKGERPGIVKTRELTAECAEAGAALRSLIFDPAAPHLSDCRRLFIAPDDSLFLLPFEAFPTPDYKDAAIRYLVEDYEIIYLNAGRDLARIALQSKDTASAGPSVVVAGPNMEMPITTYLAKVSALQSEQSAQKATAPDAEKKLAEEDASVPVRFAQEPSTVMEDTPEISLQSMGGSVTENLGKMGNFEEHQFDAFVQTTTKKLPDARVFTWEEAIEERVKLSESPQLLQILTHGLFLSLDRITWPESFQNPLLRSLLVMAGAKTIAREKVHTDNADTSAVLDDGLLTAYEVIGMNLQGTELVALTACQTALFETQPGQSVAGLRRAFSLAGAQSMIMAQWEIPAGPSAMQMEYFYDGWLEKQNGMERYTAFREAQLEVLRFARKEGFKGHPWIWAGFVYIGDPGITQ